MVDREWRSVRQSRYLRHPFIEGGDLYAERTGYRMSGAGMGPEFREWRIIW